MTRKIRIHVEVFNPGSSTEYHDLPEGWDDLTPKEKGERLTEMALNALENAAGSGASVVEVDEHDNVLRALDEEVE